MRRSHSISARPHSVVARASSPIYNHNTPRTHLKHTTDGVNKTSHKHNLQVQSSTSIPENHSISKSFTRGVSARKTHHIRADPIHALLSADDSLHITPTSMSVGNSSLSHISELHPPSKTATRFQDSEITRRTPNSHKDTTDPFLSSALGESQGLPETYHQPVQRLVSDYSRLVSMLTSPDTSIPAGSSLIPSVNTTRMSPSTTTRSTTKPTKPHGRSHVASLSSVHTQSTRHYDIPVYHGFRKAFLDQVNAYAQKEVTLVTLEDLINEWLPWYNENLEYMANYGSLQKMSSENTNMKMGSSYQPPAFSVSELEAQTYSPLYQEKLIKNAQFLWQELPIRLAKRVVELEKLPYGLSDTPSFSIVRAWYEQSFRDIVSCLPPTNLEEEKNFTRILNSILYRHRHVVPMIAQGILLAKPKINAATQGSGCPYIKEFLDRFYMSRISMRMLISQHISLHKPLPGYCGNIALFLDPIEVVRNAANEATELCDRTYGKAPEISILFARHNTATLSDATYPDLSYFAHQNNTILSDNDLSASASSASEVKLGSTSELTAIQQLHLYHNLSTKNDTISYIPSHLHHMIFELVKNSCRATVEQYPELRRLPDINITVASGRDDFTIKISDTGCGIKKKDQHKLFGYLHTTTSSSVQESLKRFTIVGNDGQPVNQGQGMGDSFKTTSSTYDELFPSNHRSESGLDPESTGKGKADGDQDDWGAANRTYSNSPAAPSADYDPYLSQPTRIQVKSHRLTSISSTSFNMDEGTNILISPAEQQGFGSGSKLPPIAGFGYGLALSKLFAQFFGGNLEIHSIENHGTDAFLWLNKLEHNKTQM